MILYASRLKYKATNVCSDLTLTLPFCPSVCRCCRRMKLPTWFHTLFSTPESKSGTLHCSPGIKHVPNTFCSGRRVALAYLSPYIIVNGRTLSEELMAHSRPTLGPRKSLFMRSRGIWWGNEFSCPTTHNFRRNPPTFVLLSSTREDARVQSCRENKAHHQSRMISKHNLRRV